MKTKEISPIETFANQVDKVSNKFLNDEMGYLLFTYNHLESGMQENTFGVRGKLANIAECLLSAMKSNEALAQVVSAAANAYGHMRMVQAQQTLKQEEQKPKIVS